MRKILPEKPAKYDLQRKMSAWRPLKLILEKGPKHYKPGMANEEGV